MKNANYSDDTIHILDDTPLVAPHEVSINKIDHSQYTIHIVDDSPLVVKVLTDVLQRKAYRVTFTENGKDAIDSIANDKPHLIILDVEMPIMDGFETIKILKANPETSNIPVIFHTTLTQPEVIGKLFELGASDYITKPFVPVELLARVEKEILNINLQNMLMDKMSKLAQALSLDPLTRLYNKLHMTSVINSKLKKFQQKDGGTFGLIYLDIDDFNVFTKMHGFVASENAIKKIAMVLKRSIRDKEILARWDADVFVIFCPQTTKQELETIAKKMRENIAKVPFVSNLNLTCSISLVKIDTADKVTTNNTIALLQNRMSEAKQVSKNSIITTDGSILR